MKGRFDSVKADMGLGLEGLMRAERQGGNNKLITFSAAAGLEFYNFRGPANSVPGLEDIPIGPFLHSIAPAASFARA